MADDQPLIAARQMTSEEMKKHTEISEDFYTVYSNYVRIAASSLEFRLFFGETYPTATGELKVTENFSVVITPPQAKSLLELLSNTLQAVEKSSGGIPEAQSLVATTETP